MNLKNIFGKNKNQKGGSTGESLRGWAHKMVIFLESNSWIFTVVFVGTIFVVSLWVWWNCIYNPRPSEKILKEVTASQKSFKQLISEIEEGIKVLEDCQARSVECKGAIFGKEIFATKEEAEWIFEKGESQSFFLDDGNQAEEKIDEQKEETNESQPEINQTEDSGGQGGGQESLTPEENVKLQGEDSNPVVMP